LGDILATTEAPTNVKVPTYLVKTSANNRYLVDQNNVPFMIVGDSPQSLIGRMSQPDATLYMANRQRYGIKTLWVNLLCNNKTACNADGTTFDGIQPFEKPGDMSGSHSIHPDDIWDTIVTITEVPPKGRCFLSTIRFKSGKPAGRLGCIASNSVMRVLPRSGAFHQPGGNTRDSVLIACCRSLAVRPRKSAMTPTPSALTSGRRISDRLHRVLGRRVLP